METGKRKLDMHPDHANKFYLLKILVSFTKNQKKERKFDEKVIYLKHKSIL